MRARPHINETSNQISVTREMLIASYARSKKMGLTPEIEIPRESISKHELKSLRSRHQTIISYSRLLFSTLHNDLQDDSQIFILTDHMACLLDLHSCPSTVEYISERYSIQPGVLLTESSCGTTATCLSLHNKVPLVLRDEEHFSKRFAGWNTASAPVLNTEGYPRYSVGICSTSDRRLGGKLALVRCIAKDLCNFLNQHDYGKKFNSTNIHNLDAEPPCIPLTDRQAEALRFYASGMTYKCIAREMGLKSVKTVQEHLEAARIKLGVRHRRECIRKALSMGIL